MSLTADDASNDARKQTVKSEADWYEIQVEGEIHPLWFNHFEGWRITPLPNGNTLLFGPVIDQPALHGLFARIRDLNLKIISLQQSSPPDDGPHMPWKNIS